MSWKRILHHDRLRKIEGSFSWIDHRFITGGFLQDLSTIEILTSLGEAREGLIMRSLIAYEPPIYQVLSLPPHPVSPPTREEIRQRQRERNLYHLRKIREALQ